MTEKIHKESVNILDENISKLKQIFPNVFSEGKIDFEKLKETLGDFVDSSNENYSFSWAGRSDSIKNMQTTSKGTLIPEKEESVNFDDTENILIEGENLEVLKLLQKAYTRKIDMIYIDPPYNTGNEFIYKDDFTNTIESYLEQTGQSKEGKSQTSTPETSGRIHSDWISFMYSRLFLAHELLSTDGVIFVSIDDNEIHNLKLLMNMIFGEDNFVSQIIINSNRKGRQYLQIANQHDYLLCYLKSAQSKINELPRDDDNKKLDDINGKFELWELRNRNPKFNRVNRPNLFFPLYINPKIVDSNGFSPVQLEKTTGYNISTLPKNSLGEDSCWRWGKNKIVENIIIDDSEHSQIIAKEKQKGGWNIYEKSRKSTVKAKTIWDEKEMTTENGTIELREIFGKATFDHPKPFELLMKCLMLGSKRDSICLDFFAGSGTLAHALVKQNLNDGGNRKFICIQIPEPLEDEIELGEIKISTIAQLCQERIRRTMELIEKERKEKLNEREMDLGFKVFKLVKSNYKTWENIKDSKELKEQLKLFENPLIENYKDIDVIYEIILKEGYSLNSKIEEFSSKPNKIYKITDGDFFFYVTLDKQLKQESIEKLKLDENVMFACLDSALDDSQKTNISKICKLRTI